jgi:carbon-monoxide dehydrogenase small subunit
MRVLLTVNGEPSVLELEPRQLLSETLRDNLGLTGTHLGCEHGVCGSCTVLLDGDPVRSCLTLAVQAQGAEITTIEGLGSPTDLHPVQRAFYDAISFQCGFCTPGFVMTAVAYLRERSEAGEGVPTDEDVRSALAGNLCRCTGYQSIVDGVLAAAQALAGQKEVT